MVSLISGPYLLVVTRKVGEGSTEDNILSNYFRPAWVSFAVERFGGWLKLKLSAMPGLNITSHQGIGPSLDSKSHHKSCLLSHFSQLEANRKYVAMVQQVKQFFFFKAGF